MASKGPWGMGDPNYPPDEVVQTYVLQLVARNGREPWSYSEPRLPDALLREIEENVNDVLNDHYRITIKEWDSDEHD